MRKKKYNEEFEENEKFGVEDFYYFYKHNKGGKYYLPVFRKVLKIFTQVIIRDYLLKGLLVKFPGRFGTLFIIRYKPELVEAKEGFIHHRCHSNINWKETLELQKKQKELGKEGKFFVFYENPETDGFFYKIKRIANNRELFNKFYNFRPAVTMRRELTKFVRKNPNFEFLTS